MSIYLPLPVFELPAPRPETVLFGLLVVYLLVNALAWWVLFGGVKGEDGL